LLADAGCWAPIQGTNAKTRVAPIRSLRMYPNHRAHAV
jgi:hypothetical protein